jgi:hypothetical protein
MRFVDWKFRRLAFLVVLPVALFSGCGDDQTSNDPVQPVSEQTAVEAAVATTEFIDAFVTSIGSVLAGDLTAGFATLRPPSSVPGDFLRDDVCLGQEPTCQEAYANSAWSATCSSTSQDCSVTASAVIQFLDTIGQAQQFPDPSTEEFTYNVDMTIDFVVTEAPPGRAADFIDYYFDFNNDMSVRDIPQQVYQAQGSGSMDLRISGELDGQTFDEAAGISWSYDLDVPAKGGCSTGTVQISVGQYTAVATYGSTGQYTVVVFLDGQEVHQEQGTSSCMLG